MRVATLLVNVCFLVALKPLVQLAKNQGVSLTIWDEHRGCEFELWSVAELNLLIAKFQERHQRRADYHITAQARCRPAIVSDRKARLLMKSSDSLYRLAERAQWECKPVPTIW